MSFVKYLGEFYSMARKKVFRVIFIFILLSFSLLLACDERQSVSNELNTIVRDDLLGTVITISIHGDYSEHLFEQSFEAVMDIDKRMSANRADSEISRLNENSEGFYSVSADIFDLIDRAIYLSKLSDGAFDITIGAFSELWRLDGDFAVLPPEEKIRDNLLHVGSDRISMSEDGRTVFMSEGMRLDLGSFAKGYSLEIVKDMLIENGVQHALLDFGGDLHAIGYRPDGQKWRIGIRSPIIGDNDIACIVEISDSSIVTSGSYERFFEQDGVIYHHILNPQTGYPAESGLLSVTVISPYSTDADALSTACFVLGLERGINLLESLDGFEGIFITDDKTIHTTQGLQSMVTIASPIFTLADDL